ncbi:MAG: VWA domain-containing protein [Armatimonadota bacterium]
MKKMKTFTISRARSLPVIILADVSGSMATNGKIDALNDSVAGMLAAFAEEDDARAEIRVCVVTFGGNTAKLHKPLAPATDTTWEPMTANGRTPMGEAFTLARQMVEDRETISGRDYSPVLVLVSDGLPNDDWQAPLDALLASERASKAARFALAIGEDADVGILAKFLADDEGRVFQAHEAREIKKFFRWVTMSVALTSRSANPNSMIELDPVDLDDLDF